MPSEFKNPFPHLKNLSLKIGSFKTSDYMDLVAHLPMLFSNLDTLDISTNYSRTDKLNGSGDFILYSKNVIKTNNLGKDRSVFRLLPNLKSFSRFASYNKGNTIATALYFKNIETNPAIFFKTQKDIDAFINNFPRSKRESITLVGPRISNYEVEDILDHSTTFSNLRNIFLVASSCSMDDLVGLRNHAEKVGIHIHKINTFASSGIQFHYDNNLFQMQQMMNNQMWNNINSNIQNIKIR